MTPRTRLYIQRCYREQRVATFRRQQRGITVAGTMWFYTMLFLFLGVPFLYGLMTRG